MRGGRKPGSKNTKPSSSQKPEVYNQHFPTLSDDEEKRLDQYIKVIREVRVNVDSHGSLNDCTPGCSIQSTRDPSVFVD